MSITLGGRARQENQKLEVNWATDQDCQKEKKEGGKERGSLLPGGTQWCQACHLILLTPDTEARDHELQTQWNRQIHTDTRTLYYLCSVPSNIQVFNIPGQRLID